eukprot:COSAG04_NODE_30797_length_260_cov_1.167702_1_plen_51_part_10
MPHDGALDRADLRDELPAAAARAAHAIDLLHPNLELLHRARADVGQQPGQL